MPFYYPTDSIEDLKRKLSHDILYCLQAEHLYIYGQGRENEKPKMSKRKAYATKELQRFLEYPPIVNAIPHDESLADFIVNMARNIEVGSMPAKEVEKIYNKYQEVWKLSDPNFLAATRVKWAAAHATGIAVLRKIYADIGTTSDVHTSNFKVLCERNEQRLVEEAQRKQTIKSAGQAKHPAIALADKMAAVGKNHIINDIGLEELPAPHERRVAESELNDFMCSATTEEVAEMERRLAKNGSVDRLKNDDAEQIHTR